MRDTERLQRAKLRPIDNFAGVRSQPLSGRSRLHAMSGRFSPRVDRSDARKPSQTQDPVARASKNAKRYPLVVQYVGADHFIAVLERRLHVVMPWPAIRFVRILTRSGGKRLIEEKPNRLRLKGKLHSKRATSFRTIHRLKNAR